MTRVFVEMLHDDFVRCVDEYRSTRENLARVQMEIRMCEMWIKALRKELRRAGVSEPPSAP